MDEFLYFIFFSNQHYIPKILGTCGNLFSIEKISNPKLPFNNQQSSFSKKEFNGFFIFK